jgi:CRP-like cAMP-binding protein
VGDSLFLVSEGRFDVFVHGSRDERVAILGRGACFGEMALLTGELRSATVRAVGPGELLRLDRDRFIDLIRSDPKIGLALSATLSRRVQHASCSLTEAREALADVVEPHLARLPPDARRNVLQASLLGPNQARSLDVVFGAEAERITAHLTEIGWSIGPALGISSAIVGLTSVLLAALAGCFNRQALQSLNWDFLISYGVILTLPRVAGTLWVNDAIAEALRALIGEGGLGPLIFVLSLAVLNTLVRLVLADDLALLGLGLALVPTAPVIGVHPWIIIITLLASFSPWFFPTQSVSYAVAYEAAEGRLFTHQQARKACLG